MLLKQTSKGLINQRFDSELNGEDLQFVREKYKSMSI